MEKPRSSAPLIIANGLLILPLLYVGSYFALIDPPGVWIKHGNCLSEIRCYRIGGENAKICFWPLEQIDRKVRPAVWAIGSFRPEDFSN
jgi:hypothetical protein